ncbi:hypothetical protein [Mucilaginibacter sp.]|uniref:hypothetical protein n=1 Tax=Mucilaginibacter sp. TaxID=1882438 RepID=UPI00261BA683|nr:hypothetical protein [Mucilaginibacter sp.]MDB4919328.1 hypothetical protein [Mucilaginibacter sp.]
MDELNFINNSSDQNNSSIVIFQPSVQSLVETAWLVVSLNAGAVKSVPVTADTQFHVAIINPEITVNGGVMKIGALSAPAVSMVSGQTAYITGESDSGYEINVEG